MMKKSKEKKPRQWKVLAQLAWKYSFIKENKIKNERVEVKSKPDLWKQHFHSLH